MKVIKLVQKKHPEMGDGKIRRVYENEGFSLSKKPRKRIKDNPSNPISIPLKANQEWAMDFMSDALSNGAGLERLTLLIISIDIAKALRWISTYQLEE